MSDYKLIRDLIEASSLGTPEAEALRESVTDEQAARAIARANELRDQCGVTLTYYPRRLRSGALLLASHGGTHTCKLAPGHPASGPGYVPVHQCRDCTLCWESDPRPSIHCTCQASLNPYCPTHGHRRH